METKEDVKIEQETMMQSSFKVTSNLNGPEKDQDPKMSTIQAKRRFMITDILNSAAENANKEQKGLDMRLLFPGVTRLPLHHSPDSFHKLHSPDLDDGMESDNDADEGDDDADDKGE